MKKTRKIVSIVLATVLLLSVFIITPISVSAADISLFSTGSQSMSGNFSKNYTVTGDGATDMVNIAMAQNERTKAQLGYTESWCADFVSDCAKLAGQSAAIPFDGFVPTLYNSVINAGGQVVASAKAGDLVFFSNGGSYGHVGIATDGSHNISGNINYNNSGVIKVCVLQNSWEGYSSWTFVRPNYRGTAPTPINPQGCLDEVSSPSPGKLKVRGWAFDRDSLGASLAIHVYVGGPAGSGAPMYAITANKSRPDVNNHYPGVGNNHGFEDTISVSRTGSQAVYVYAINVGSGNDNPLLGSRTVNIQSDTTKPTISNIAVSQVTSKGYRVSCKVSDNVGVAQVKFPTWTLKADSNGNNQDDLVWHIGSLEGNIATFYVKTNDHKNETGGYITDVYAYDSSNNYTVSRVAVTVTDEPKEISSIEYNGNTYKVFNSGKTWAEAEEWCEKQGGHLATITSNNERIAVNGALEKFNGVPCWLGAESTSGTWKWVTGENFNYTNWSTGQPDCGSNAEFYLGTFNSTKKWLDCYLWNDYPSDGSSRIGGFVCEFEKEETTTPGEVVTVYFKNNSDFLTPYAYYWTYGSIGPIDWPGVAMTKVKDDIYKVDVPVENNMIIFSDNGKYQTADLNMGGKYQIYDNGWKDYEEAPTETPIEAPTKRPTVCEHGSRITVYYPATYFDKDKTVVSCTDCGKVIKKFTGSKKVLNTPKVTVKPAKKAVTVKYTKVKHAQGFVVSYRIGKKTYTKTFKGNKSKTVKISNLKKGKKYSVKVRAYTISMKKKAYSAWTKAKTVKVK